MSDRIRIKAISPILLLVGIILQIFLVELISSILVMSLPELPKYVTELLAGLLSILILTPILFLTIIRPLIHEISRREKAEAELKTFQGVLEKRVELHTAELETAQDLLQHEIEDRQQAQAVLERERGEIGRRVHERTQQLRKEVGLYQELTSQLRLQTTALDAAANGVFITNKKGDIEWANKSFYQMTGYEPEEVIGMNPRMLKSGLYGRQFYDNLWNTILSGQVWQGEIVNLRKDGNLYIEDQIVTPVLDERGNITHFIAIQQDISERKHAEDIIRNEAAHVKIRAGIEEALTNASPSFQTVLDITVQRLSELIGDVCYIHLLSEGEEAGDLYLADTYPKLIEREDSSIVNIEQVADTLGVGAAEYVLKTGGPLIHPTLDIDGSEVYQINELQDSLNACSILIIPLRNQGRKIGTLTIARRCTSFPFTTEDKVIIQDLSERVALALAHARLYQHLVSALGQEQSMRAQLVQNEKFAAIGRMIASVAHELNNPLQTIKNCLYLIDQDITEAPSREFLDLASSEINRLTGLVDQLREVYRPRNTNQLQVYDLGKLLEEVHQLMIVHLQDNHVAWESPFIAKPIYIQGISDQLKQVFLNVGLNAVESMQPNGGIIHITIQDPDPTGLIAISIQDNGPGINPDLLSRVFEPLFTTKEKGLGLGLFISYDIVQKHGGKITVESVPGEGANFTIWLPVNLTPTSELLKGAV